MIQVRVQYYPEPMDLGSFYRRTGYASHFLMGYGGNSYGPGAYRLRNLARAIGRNARNWAPYLVPAAASIRVRRNPGLRRRNAVSLAPTVRRGLGITPAFRLRDAAARVLQQRKRKKYYNLGKNKPGCYAELKKAKIYPMKTLTDSFKRLTKAHNKHVDVWNTDQKFAASQHTSQVNQVAYWYKIIGASTELQAFEGRMKKVDDTVGTFKSVNLTNVNSGVKIAIRGHMTLKMKNNTGTDIHVTVYYFKYSDSSNATPTALVTDGLSDHVNSATTPVTNPEVRLCYYPEHSYEFARKCKVLKKYKACIEPGKEINCDIHMQSVLYDPQLNDRIGGSYLADCTTGILIRQHGQIGHDQATTGNVGILASALDVIENKKYTYGYYTRADIPVHDCSESFGAITVGVAANDEGDEREDNAV